MLNKKSDIEITWPDGSQSYAKVESFWLEIAEEAGIEIPTACMKGSCGACEIEVNGKIIRSCVSKLTKVELDKIVVTFPVDPYW